MTRHEHLDGTATAHSKEGLWGHASVVIFVLRGATGFWRSILIFVQGHIRRNTQGFYYYNDAYQALGALSR